MTSIREQLQEAVVAALETITAANGYDNDLPPGRVQRFRQGGQTLLDCPVLLVLFGIERKERSVNDRYDCALSVLIDIIVADPEEEVGVETQTKIDSLLTDVERAIAAAGNFGNLAYESAIAEIVPGDLIDGAPFVGTRVDLVLSYRHADDDPRELAN